MEHLQGNEILDATTIQKSEITFSPRYFHLLAAEYHTPTSHWFAARRQGATLSTQDGCLSATHGCAVEARTVRSGTQGCAHAQWEGTRNDRTLPVGNDKGHIFRYPIPHARVGVSKYVAGKNDAVD